MSDEVVDVCDTLLDHSAIHYRDINANSNVVFLGWGPHRWTKLEPAAQRYVGDATQAREKFVELARRSVLASAPERVRAFDKAGRVFERVITERDKTAGAPASTVDGVREVVRNAIAAEMAVIEELPSAHRDGGQFLVPDTNALLFRPDIEQWSPPPGNWTIVLVPQVLRELDELKMRPHLADKATSVIKRVKEYGRRGDTFTGVKVAGRLSLREVAVDADMSAAPTWLRAGHGDDELLASILELQWADLQATVVLATRDRNMANKARMGRVQTLDVEDEL
jgi:hypothetical protein